MSFPQDFETLVRTYHRDLYHFALSLAGSEADACDLVQQTFYIWASKGHNLREPRAAKSWLFTTLHREYLQGLRRRKRYCEYDAAEMEEELVSSPPDPGRNIDARLACDCLAKLEERFRAPLALFYLEDFSYLEISAVLDLPLGTVQSRISRGKAQLLQMLTSRFPSGKTEEVRHD